MKKQNRQRKQNRFFNTKLGRYDNIPSTTELFDRVKEINSLTAKALISLLYLTGARVCEVVKTFRVNQIQEIKRGDHSFVHFVCLPTQKKRIPAEEAPRTIPVHKGYYMGFLKFIYAYIGDNDLVGESILFNFTDRNARYLVDHNLGMNNHRLRHIRATNLAREEAYTDSMLKRFFNWSSSSTAANYTHYNTMDLEALFLQSLDEDRRAHFEHGGKDDS